jgi:hypothetical protein
VLWLASLVTEGDHRNVSGETARKGIRHTLSHLTAQSLEPLDFRDDRLRPLLTPLRKPASWHQMEPDGNAQSIEVSNVSQDVIRGEATTVSGEPEVPAAGLLPCGQSKDEPTRPQIKGMRGS